MFKSIRVRASQGSQFIPDPRRANPAGFRGKPLIGAADCATGCQACADICPSSAITLGSAPVQIDLGRCTLCGACAPACPSGKIAFTTQTAMAASERTALVVSEGPARIPDVDIGAALRARFGRSLKLRQVSAGGCNGCELELNALANVNFDIGRHGIEWVASPRHADALVVSGPITKTMADAVQLAWDAMAEPRFVIAVGACAISGGLYDGAPGVDRGFFDRQPPLIYVPGCPPHPLTIARALLMALGR